MLCKYDAWIGFKSEVLYCCCYLYIIYNVCFICCQKKNPFIEKIKDNTQRAIEKYSFHKIFFIFIMQHHHHLIIPLFNHHHHTTNAPVTRQNSTHHQNHMQSITCNQSINQSSMSIVCLTMPKLSHTNNGRSHCFKQFNVNGPYIISLMILLP